MNGGVPGAAGAAPRARLEPALVYLPVAFIAVAATVFLTPPLQVPDEHQHFFRAYQLSTGQVIGETRGGAAGTLLPSSLVALERRFLTDRIDQRAQTATPFPIGETWRSPAIPLAPARTEFVAFTTMSLYGPLAYLPQAVAIAIGRWGGLDVLSLLLLARLLNGWAAVALTAWAIRLLPIGREAALAVALLPMTLFQFASVSMDAGVIACAFLFSAAVVRSSLAGAWTVGSLVTAAACGIVFCSAKIVYAPLLLLGLWPAIGEWRRGNRRLLGNNLAILLAGAGSAAAWLSSVRELMLPVDDVVPAERIAWLLHHPLQYAGVMANTLLLRAVPWFMQAVGKLGWLMFWLPWPVYAIAAIGLVASCLAADRPAARMRPAFAGWALFVVLTCVASIMTAAFVAWSRAADGIIDGIQGRYFTPLLLVMASALASLSPEQPAPRANRLYAAGLACGALAIGAMFLTLVQRFQLV